MSILSLLVHIHSVVRWLVLVFLLIVIISSAYKLARKLQPGRYCPVINRFAMTFTHLQLLLGLILYFVSPKVVFAASSMKDSVLRFFLVEHIGLMLVAVALVTIGFVKSQKAEQPQKKYKSLIIFYSIALIIILAAIPWPFRALGAAWF
jgi:hypothetical protein